MNLGKLILRLVIGGLFVGHGLQKLRGSFGGPGLDGASKMMESLEMHPARRNAVLASGTETVGGAAIALGLLTPVASAGLIATMLTAIRKVHWRMEQRRRIRVQRGSGRRPRRAERRRPGFCFARRRIR